MTGRSASAAPAEQVAQDGEAGVPDWLGDGMRHIWLPYAQMRTTPAPLAVAATEGVRIRLADGRELIDALASWWTACHGYNHPHIVGEIKRQAEVMPHVMFGGLAHEPALTLARRLAAILPDGLARVFFSDSGSVAVEVALKMAIQFWVNRGIKGRKKFIAFRHAYHGDTTGAMAVSDTDDGMHQLFKGAIPEHFLLDLPRTKSEIAALDDFIKGHRDQIAGLIIEPLVQAAGGFKFHGPETLAAIHKICARHDVLFIADEVATGFGRTGTLFACEHAGITPDIMCLSKALTGGAIGLGATVATARVFDAFLSDDPDRALMHGPSYMANPLATAAANASLDLFERAPRLNQVRAIADHLSGALAPCRALAGVADVRAFGAIGVVELDGMRGLDWLRARLIEEGVWLRPFDNVVYTMPALVISPDDLTRVTDAMVKIVTEWSRKFA
jgi:adenosylmethionine-8-amino-7-oxononanoate aminotransferase